MLCFMCLADNRDAPRKAITHVQGTAICDEHVEVLRQNGQQNLAAMSNGNNGGGGNGGSVSDQIRQLPLNEQIALLERFMGMAGGKR